MSLRPNIAGFDLATFRSLLTGRVNRRCADAVVVDVAMRLSDAEARDVLPVLTAVRRILNGELVRGGVDAEDSTLVNAVIALATTGQRPSWTDADRSPTQYIDFATRFPAAPSDLGGTASPGPSMQTLIRWALLQRPIFGDRQSDWWSAYGYLSNWEVERLLAYHREHPTLGDHEPTFARRFFGWLEEIRDAGQDYWFHSSARRLDGDPAGGDTAVQGQATAPPIRSAARA